VLHQTMHDVIGSAVAFFLGQLLAKSANKFAGASQRERCGKTQHVPACRLWR
jgi:hypothetical protein